MKRALIYNDSRFPRMVVCDISSPELRTVSYLRMFNVLNTELLTVPNGNGRSLFTTPDLMDGVESQLFHQAAAGNAKAAMAFLLLVQPAGLIEVDVEVVDPPRSATISIPCPEAISEQNVPA
jgi:hypothetical protein